MNYLVELSAIHALFYITIITLIYGWQKSFSDTYYIKEIGWKFSAWCWTMGLLLFLGLYKDAPTVLFPAFGFFVVGFTPKMKEKWIKPVHFYGALIIIVGSCIMLVSHYSIVYGLTSAIIIGLFYWLADKYKLNNYILWIEILAFTLTYIKII